MISVFFGCVSCHWSRIRFKLSANPHDFTSFPFYTTTGPSFAVRYAATTTRKSWKSPRAIHFVCFSTLAFRYPMFFSRFIYSHKRRIKRKWDYTWSRALTSLWNILWSTSSQKDKTWYYWRKKRKSLSKHLNGFRISCPVKREQEHPTSLWKLSITMAPNVALRSNFFRLYCLFAIVADYYPPYSRLPRLKKIDKEHTV